MVDVLLYQFPGPGLKRLTSSILLPLGRYAIEVCAWREADISLHHTDKQEMRCYMKRDRQRDRKASELQSLEMYVETILAANFSDPDGTWMRDRSTS